MIDSLKKLQVLKDHAASKSFLTVYLSSSCSWSRHIASKDGHSSGLTTIFFETVPLKYCPTISTSLLTTFSTLISLLRSPAPLLQNASLFVTIFLLNKTLTVSTSQFHDFMYLHMPYITLVVDFLGVLVVGFFLPHCTGAVLQCLGNVLGLNTFLAVFWRACSWTCPSFRLSFFYPIFKLAHLAYLHFLFMPSSLIYITHEICKKIPSSRC